VRSAPACLPARPASGIMEARAIRGILDRVSSLSRLREVTRRLFAFGLGGARRFAALVVALFVVTVLIFGVVHVVNPPRRTYRFVVPEGAHGRFLLRCFVPTAPPLPIEDGFRLVRFGPGSRVIDTSDEYIFGNEWYREEHFVEGNRGRRNVDIYCHPFPSMQHVRVDVTCDFP